MGSNPGHRRRLVLLLACALAICAAAQAEPRPEIGLFNQNHLSINGQVISSGTEGLVAGNGRLAEERRPLDNVERVELAVPATLVIERADRTRILVSAEENLIPLIRTRVRDNLLRIDASDPFTATKPLRLVLETPSISAVTLSGAGDIDLRDAGNADLLSLTAKGSGTVRVRGGTAGRLSVDAQGASQVHAAELSADSADVQLLGASSAEVTATDAIRVSIRGAGQITVFGDPGQRQEEILGVGRVRYH